MSRMSTAMTFGPSGFTLSAISPPPTIGQSMFSLTKNRVFPVRLNICFHGCRTTLFKGRVRERPETLQGQSSRRTPKNRSAARRIAWSGSAEPCGRGFFTSLWIIGWLIARRCYRTLCPRLCQSHQTSSLGMCIYSLRRRYKFVAS